MKLEFTDSSVFVANKETDTFFNGFNSNLILRESCYSCGYCGEKRVADFTIADFWGVTDERATAEQKKKGISVIVVNSEKAESILKDLNKEMIITPISSDEVVPYNRSFIAPNQRPIKRDKFFYMLKKGKDYNKIINKILWKRLTKKKIKSLVGEKNIAKIKAFVGKK